MAFRKTSSVLDYVSSTSPPKPFKGRPRTMSIQVPTGTTDILGNDHGDYKILNYFFKFMCFKNLNCDFKICQNSMLKEYNVLSFQRNFHDICEILGFCVLGSSSIETCQISNIFCIFLQAGADVNIKTNIRNSTRTNRFATKDFR